MIHLGDITKINGAEIEPVDCITGGSPCQDLSVAGKRAGLAGERSGLFMEQIRVIKEMRQHEKECGRADEFIRPRWMVWENVPGAFSSNGGEDFRAVLEETARVADENAVIPRLAKGQKWTPAGCIMGDGWSIAWRVHDAQFWGVPQRRKRISLVADFGGGSAPKILFERKSVHGDFEKSGNPREETPRDAGEGAAQTGRAISFQERAGKPGGGKGILIQDEHKGALSTLNNQSVVYGISAYDSNSMKSPNPNSGIYKAETARTLDLNGGSPACNQGGMAVVCLEGNGARPSHQGSGYTESETMYTLNSTEQHGVCMEEKKQTVFDWHRQDTRMKELKDVCVTAAAGWGGGGNNMPYVLEEQKAPMVMSKEAQMIAYGIDRAAYNQGKNALYDFSVEEEKIATQVAKGPGADCAAENCQKVESIVRRLTPMECERLQGYPDGWTNIGDWTDSKGKVHKGDSDSPRYKALGNSIALPFWFYLLRRISATYERPATLGSLFDGIGGFPLCWETCNGKGTARWASEIEEFPIAVTKKHFKEDT